MIGLEPLIGESAPIVAVREQAARLLANVSGPARRLPPVLILGETGTGKGLLAGALHRAGPRAAGPFVDVNCAAIPETLLEAELFGFERGAFTDARQGKTGLFQAANGGTIFLDEIGLLPLALQSKLLKVIEERSVRRLGSTRNESLDVSIVAATSEDLAAAVQRGHFRADLYHRLAVVPFVLPPLRNRGRDVLILAEHFLSRISTDYSLPPRVLTEDAKAALLAHPWPGNVRELANVLERAAVLSGEPRVTAAGLGLPPPQTVTAEPARAGAASCGDADTERERQVLLEALRATDWNFTRAAARLALPRNTLRYRVERLGLGLDGAPARRRGGRPPATRPVPAPATGAMAGLPAAEPAGADPRRPGPAAPADPGMAAAPIGDMRRVTLLAVRVLAVSAEPGAWDTSRAVEESTAKVQSFGGRIEEAGGTDVLASFGLDPEEDASRHAAHAALAVCRLAARAAREAAQPPELKVALHTDVLPVIRAARELELEAEALNRARLILDAVLGAAPAGTVVASAAAGRFLARRFELAPLSPTSRAAAAYQVIRPAESPRARFVGRVRELQLLMQRFELAQAGQGQVVVIVGEPGIGKSRLLSELRQRLGRRATWIEGHALAFGRSMPFHPVVDMLRRVFRIDDADPEAVVVDKIEAGVRRLGPETATALPFVRYLLSVDPGDPAVLAMEPKRRHAAVVTATRLLLERGADRRPHVLVVEDVHWCDSGTEDWIARLADGITAQRVLLLLTSRPGYRPPIGGGSVHTALALSTLSGDESLQIAAGLLGAAELPPQLRALVVDKAEGNPFFIEELVRSLEEVAAVRRGGERVAVTAALERLAVPDTIHEILRARIERLEPRLRNVLEVAAVIGRSVPFTLLHAVTGDSEASLREALRQLQVAEFLYETRLFPELEHTFKHALTQDVAYAALDPARRRTLHARIVKAIVAQAPDRLGEHVERLAYHALHGEWWTEAVRFSREAGVKAFDRSANREAVASFEQALTALTHLPESTETQESAIDIRLALRSALLQLGEIRKIATRLREAETIATALDDRRRLAWVWTYMTIAHLFAGDPGEAQSVGELARALADEVGDVGLCASARTPLAHAYRERGDYRQAIALYREAMASLTGDLVRERLGQAMPPALYARSMSATCLAELGGFPEAVALATESAELARAQDLPFGLALARLALGHTALIQGRLADAISALDAALELMTARGVPTWFPWVAALKGYALALAGNARDGVPLMQQALERAAALPFLFGHSQWVAWLAHAQLTAGAPDVARASAEEAVRLSRRRGERGYEAWALHVMGEVEARRGGDGPARADACQRRALALATELGMRPLIARCHLGLAALGASADSERAREHRDAGRTLCIALAMSLPAGQAAPTGTAGSA